MKIENNYIFLKRILLFYKPFRSRIVVISLCMIVYALIHMLNPLIGKLIIDNGFLQKSVSITVKLVMLSFILISVQQAIDILQTRLLAHLHAKTSFYMNKSALEHLLKTKIEFFNNANFSEILNNINSDIRNINRVSEKNTFYVLTEILKLFGGTVALIAIDFRLTCLILTTIPLRYIIIKYLAKRKEYSFEVYMDVNRKYYSWYGDIIGGIKEIKLLGIDKVIKSQYINHQRNIIKADINMAVLDAYNNISETMLYNTLVSALYIIGAYFITSSSMSLGSLFAFITYSSYVTYPISAIMNIRYELSSIIPAAKRFFDFLDFNCEDDNSRKEIPINGRNIKGHIEFKNVSFSYTRETNVLKDISFEIKPGEKVAIVGQNGSGKSTIINLLQKLYKPEGGAILIDGIDIQSIKLSEYRKLISYVSQDTYLFNTSIRNNITLFSDVEDSCLYKAVQLSCAREFIEKLPDKYESRTGRNGLLLSSGQKQKIAIARALLRDSRIILFDEATSNCDLDSETQINTIIKNSMENKTVIVISHKPSILKVVDRVLLIQDGVVKSINSSKNVNNVIDTYDNDIKISHNAV